MRRLALLALLLASSSIVAAPAPLPKPQRKAERPAAHQAQQSGAAVTDDFAGLLANIQVDAQPLFLPAQPAAPQAPAQPPNADPPG